MTKLYSYRVTLIVLDIFSNIPHVKQNQLYKKFPEHVSFMDWNKGNCHYIGQKCLTIRWLRTIQPPNITIRAYFPDSDILVLWEELCLITEWWPFLFTLYFLWIESKQVCVRKSLRFIPYYKYLRRPSVRLSSAF